MNYLRKGHTEAGMEEKRNIKGEKIKDSANSYCYNSIKQKILPHK